MTQTRQAHPAPAGQRRAARAHVVSLDQIDIAPENLRAREPSDADIPELADTIDAAGLL